MRAEHHRPGFGGAVGVGDLGLGQRPVQRLHQALAHRCGAHADELDAGEIGARDQLVFAQHHRDHRRHGGEPGAAVARDRFDIGARGELRQQHNGGMRRAVELAQGERIHVIERRRDEETVGGKVLPFEPCLHHPDVALVRQHHALGRPRRTGGVEEHCRLVGPRDDRRERAGIEEGGKAIPAFTSETHERHPGRALRPSRRIAEHELRAAIAQDEFDGRGGKPVIDGHRDEARTHDAVIGREIFGAVGREDGDALAARKSARPEAAGDAHRHAIEVGIGETALARFAAEVDDGELALVAVAADEIAEIGERGRHARSITPSAAR